ncbi:NAD(P)/FAD-dependent oxidoreductase [Diaphorobacter ruginosibacter]|uniref:NAD(P)/FAD-dependent oxidoreductase n=1 Tax=Diaphorobacter ruginosibacter TaxID=1715720 RepID=UPI001FE29AB9|nr:FAD-binding oxidoreductase [Diaphorobacter ruginosibacter]
MEGGDIASGTTGRSFGWINTSLRPVPDPMGVLRRIAIQEYHRLEQELPELAVQWIGALTYGAASEAMQGSDPADGVLMATSARIRDLEPRLKHPPDQARFAPEEGALDAVKATHTLIAGAQAHGAKVLTRTPVLRLLCRGSRLTGVETSVGMLEADMVVLAAGTGTEKLIEQFNVTLPVDASPAIFIRYKPQPKLIHTIISSPAMEVRQDVDGVLFAAEDYLDDSPDNQPAAVAQRTARAMEGELEGAAPVEPEWSCVGFRPIPRDGAPIIGYLPGTTGLYVCVMHPGVTLAAAVGRLASEEIVHGVLDSSLDSYRPARFLQPRD